MTRAFIDRHCHTSASFDSLARPAAVVRAAAARGLTHLAITDHETVDGALEAREAARTDAPDLTVIVGEEVRTLEGNTSTAEGLRAALTNVSLVPGRASYIVRTLTPIAKLVNRARGNRRVVHSPPGDPGASS